MSSKLSIEELTISVLKKAKQPLLIREIVDEIKKIEPEQLKGKTPTNSLYSIIYRHEAKRKDKGEKELFSKIKRGKQLYLEMNNKK